MSVILCMCLRSPRPRRCLLRNNDFERSFGVDEPVLDKLQAAPLKIRPSSTDVSKSPTVNRPVAFQLATAHACSYKL